MRQEKEEASGLLNAPSEQINAGESRINAELNRINAELNRIEKKENKKENSICIGAAPDSEVEKAFDAYILMRRSRGRLSDVQVQELSTVLAGITSDPAEQVQVIRQATVHGWNSFYPLRKPEASKQPAKAGSSRKTSSFYNFEQRKIDYAAQEIALLNMTDDIDDADPELKEGAG